MAGTQQTLVGAAVDVLTQRPVTTREAADHGYRFAYSDGDNDSGGNLNTAYGDRQAGHDARPVQEIR